MLFHYMRLFKTERRFYHYHYSHWLRFIIIIIFIIIKCICAPDDVVVDSVVTVIDELDSKCWLIALIVFVSDEALLPILLNDIEDDVLWVEAALELDVVELFALLQFVPLLTLSLLLPFVL